ncbi:ABC transporter ATP-binding protein, partial [Candidatus Woesearchaeota archaeon]|nr:ABC transporter ATP-binding protein [Candidatus Woesearchaeota archaeon]
MIKEVLELISPLKKALKYVFLGALILELLKLIPNVIFKELIDSLIVFDKSGINYVIFLVVLSFAVSIVVSLTEKFFYNFSIKTIVKSEVSLMKKAQQKLMNLSLGYHEKHHTGKQVTRLTKGIHHLNVLMWHSIFDFIPVCLQIIYSTTFIFFVSWKVGILFVIFIPIFLVYTHKMALKIQPIRHIYHECFEKASGKLGEMVINIRTVKDFNQEDAEKKLFDNQLDLYHQYVQQRREFENFHFTIRDVILQVGRIITLSVSIYLVYIGEITAGSLVLIVTLNEKAFASVYRVGRTYNYVGDSISGVQRLIDLMKEKALVIDKKSAKLCKKLKGSIEFKDVDFSYTKGEQVLKDINFKVKPKQVIALVGRSGCGKSTIIKLLYRHFDIDSGTILLDGKDITSFKMESFRKHFAIVSQDVELFNASILENLTYGVDNFSTKEVIKAAKMAHAHEFIEQFKAGYATIVGEKGVKLSGGQKQRLGIARALLRKPSILVFDEATSSLDTESEKYIQEAMGKLFK